MTRARAQLATATQRRRTKPNQTPRRFLYRRTHRCPHCGHIQDRDPNAAINILELALRTVGHRGTLNASFDIDLCLGGATPLSKPSRGKRRASKK
uniref:zinc ribbon domain-containing protein n=1 Tax=Microseira wollei TaxID=467598 RepID=UPI0027D94F29|nr:zinc ribbon domain-containing protein [Microseira wollei]